MIPKGEMGTENPMGMEMASEGETTTLSLEKYPELEGLEPGAPVSGKWSGKVQSVEDGRAVIAYDSLELETENKADKELKRLRGQEQGELFPGGGAGGEEDDE